MDYAVTFTLKPKYHESNAFVQYDILLAVINRCYDKFKKSIVVEFTKAGNLHAHGVIYSTTKRAIHDARKRSDLGFIVVKPIEEWEGWIEYMTKDTIDTYKELDRKCNPMIVNDHQIPFKLNKVTFDDAEYISDTE